MEGVLEALYIFDEHNRLTSSVPILSHVYTGRPLAAAQLLPLYLEQQRQQAAATSSASSALAASASLTASASASGAASSASATTRRPPASVVYLANTNPATLVFSVVHGGLLLLVTSSSEVEPLLALAFLHRVADALEDFVGSPLLAGKIEASYDVVAQLLTEMCDAGTVGTTEPNALHELVEVEGLVGKLLGSITLPGKAAAVLSSAASQAAGAAAGGLAGSPSGNQSPLAMLVSTHLGGGGGGGGGTSMGSGTSMGMSMSRSGSGTGLATAAAAGPALPWRRANVRHTSNEMYADIVESLSVTLAPSGRPLAAFAHGSIAFNSKVSGVPDILLTLTAPSGKHTLGHVLELPVFHPCVRLARWKERPGELSFVPPDGRFVLAAYEVDLMPFDAAFAAAAASSLRLPVTVDMQTSLGPAGAEFEVRAAVNRTFAFGRSAAGAGAGRGVGLGGPHPGSPGAPLLEDVRITVPLPADVRSLLEIHPTRGDAVYNPGEHVLEWQIPSKDVAGGVTSFGLRCTVVGGAARAAGGLGLDDDDDDDNDDNDGGEGAGEGSGVAGDNAYGFPDYAYDAYDEPYQPTSPKQAKKKKGAKAASKKTKKTAKSQAKLDKTDKADKADRADRAATGESSAEAAARRRVARNRRLMPTAAALSFSVKGWLASGVRIESMVLDPKRSRGLGEGVKPFKGVKYLTVSKGGIELRC